MNNFKIEIAYDGTNFNGWQNQGNTENTIQNIMEKVLSEHLKQKIELVASGRTDKGVHARCQTASFKANNNITSQKLDEINEALPNSIVIKSCKNASERFHARYNALEKTYRVKILNDKYNNPLSRNYVYHFEDRLDIEKMIIAAQDFIGKHDCASFSSAKKTKKSTERTILSVEFIENGSEIDILFTGDGFLYNQVRIMCGTLIDIGLNKLSSNAIKDAFKENDRQKAGHTIPPYCLYLDYVKY